MKIRVFGTESASNQYAINVIRHKLDDASVPYDLEVVQDVNSFIHNKILSVPAIQVDDKPIVSLGTNGSFNKNLRGVVTDILEQHQYGTMMKLVIGIDFSETSLNALYYAQRLATKLHAALKIIHVHKPIPKVDDTGQVDISTAKAAKQKLADIKSYIESDWGSDILHNAVLNSEFIIGFPGDKLLDKANSGLYDIMITGATGIGGKWKQYFGSVSNHLLDEAQIPVLVVPDKVGFRDISNICLAIDPHSFEDVNTMFLKHLATSLGAKIDVIHVATKDHSLSYTNALMKVSEALGDTIRNDKTLEGGNVSDVILEYCKKNAIDMLAITKSTKGLLAKITGKSVTNNLKVGLECPLLAL